VKLPTTSAFSSQKGSLEIATLILESDPGASAEMIGDVISEWGELIENHASEAKLSTGIKAKRRLDTLPASR
jgi:hypothetical protein